MRIVSGKYRHRKLQANPGQTTRPITDRVKVSLFDRLGPELHDMRVADLFAGTGSLGFEALSRGARSVVFMEHDRVAFDLLQHNVAALKAQEDTFCWQTDVSRSSFRPKNAERFLPFDVIFFDPPYSQTERLGPGQFLYRALTRLARDDVSSAGALLVLRCGRATRFEIPPVWGVERQLDYSSMEVHLFRKRPTIAAPQNPSAADADAIGALPPDA